MTKEELLAEVIELRLKGEGKFFQLQCGCSFQLYSRSDGWPASLHTIAACCKKEHKGKAGTGLLDETMFKQYLENLDCNDLS